MGTLTLLCLLALTSFTLAEPKCRGGCYGSTPKAFRYEEGSTYVYKIEGKTLASVTNAEGEAASLDVQATATIAVQPNCAHYVKLSDISVTGSDGKKRSPSTGVETYPLRYNFHDGHIDAEVCANDQDSNQGVNLKRALISLFQVGAHVQGAGSTTSYETDVFGTCPTEFTFSKDGDVLKVNKKRNLNLCANREHFVSAVIANPYRSEASLQNTPIQASTLEVTQVIKNGILQSAESVEEYLYRPHSTHDAGAKTKVTTKVTLVSSRKAGPSLTNVNQGKSIIFDPPHLQPTPGNLENILAAVKTAHEGMAHNVGPTSAQDFGSVVFVLRQSTKEDILKAYDQIHHKKMFQDALLSTSTGEAIEAALEIFKRKEFSPTQLRLWSLSLNVVRHATPGALAAVAAVIESPEISRYGWLGAGALAGRYCREHDCSGNVPELNALLTKLAAPIAGGCKPKTKEAENKVILSLKSLRNARYLGSKADAVASCASDTSIPARVRVAALEAYVADSCSPKLRKSALAILKNTEEDSEIRIKAYLALVDCPNAELATAIKDLIENEPSNQVGAFIVSHLRNIRASVNPEKESARHYLGGYKPRKRFPNDLRKFSRNFEVSGLLDIINVGGNAESNLIYSQRSFIPRSISLNLTADVFGHSINVAEFGIRTENVDRVIENIFGPKGLAKTRDLNEEGISKLKDRWSQLTDKVKGRFSQAYRGKRSVSQAQINDVSKKVNLGPNQIDGELEIDLSLKLFGSEGVWTSYHGGRKVDADAVVDKVFDKLDAGINKAKKFDQEIRTHARFLDTEIIYPTALGIPLKLATSGNSAIHLIVQGEIDVQTILKDPKNANAQLRIEPSADIDLSGYLLIDAGSVATGIKLRTAVHTSTGAVANIKTLDGQGIDVDFRLPQAQNDIINLKSEVVTFTKGRGERSTTKPLTFAAKRRDYKGCFDQLSPLTGLTVCAEVGYPIERPTGGSPLFPLNGPAVLSVRTIRDDPSLTGYHLKAYYDRKNPNKRTFEFLVETPNSKTERKLSIFAEAQKSPEPSLKISLYSPWKKASIEGQIQDNEKGQLLVGKLTSDNKQYSVKAGLDVTGSPDARTYAPVLEYTAGNRKESIKDGKSPVQLTGTITILKSDSERTYKFNALTLTTPAGAFSADGTVTRGPGKLGSDIKLAHEKHSVTLNSKYQRIGDGHYKVFLQAVPAQYPDFGFSFSWENEREPGQCKQELVLVHGPNLKSDTSKLTLSQSVKYKGDSLSNFEGSALLKASYPLLGVDATFDGSASRNAISYNLQAAYDKKKLDSKLSAKTNIKALRDYELIFHVKLNNKGIAIESKREKPTPEQSKLYHKLELTPGGKYELISNVNFHFEKKNVQYKSDHLLKLNGQPDIKTDNALAYSPGRLDTHCLITYGDTKYVDTLVKIDRSSPGKVDGNFKVIIKDFLNSNGEVKYAGGKGNANFVLDIPKAQRKIQGKAECTVTGSLHNANAELLWNADKDPSQKLQLVTSTDILSNSVDSKNKIKFLENNLELNAKVATSGSPRDGTGNLDVSAVLPSGRRLGVKVKRDLHVKPAGEKSNGALEVVLTESKGENSHTLTYKSASKDVDLRQGVFDSNAELTYKSSTGTDLTATLVGSNKLKGEDHYVTEAKGNLQASFLSKPIAIQWSSENTPNGASYSTKGTSICGVVFDVHGESKISPEERHCTTVIDLQNLPLEQLSDVKLKSNWVLKSPSGSPCEVGAKNLANLLEKMKTTKSMKLASTISKLAPNLLPSCEGRTTNELTWGGKTAKLEGIAKADLRRGAAKVKLVLPNDVSRVVSTTWVQELDNDVPKITTNFKASWEDNKEISVDFKGEGNKELNDIKVNLVGVCNLNEKHKAEVNVHHKRRSEKAIDTQVEVNLDGKKLKVGADVNVDQTNPHVDITLERAAGKSRLYVKGARKSDTEFEGEGDVLWVQNGGGQLQWKVKNAREGDVYKSYVNLNSAKLNLNNFESQVAINIPSKKFDIDVKDASGNLVSGSGTYEKKEENSVITLEGSGNIKIKDQAHSLKVNVITGPLTLAKDQEIGRLVQLDSQLDGKEFVNIIQKESNRQFHRLLRVCYKDKCCIHEVDSKLKVSDFFEHNYQLTYKFDFRGAGFPNTVNLKASNVRKGSIVDNEAELVLGGTKDVTIKTKAYVHETSAGVVLALPKRTIEAVASFELPKSKSNSIRAEASLWLDKVRNPALKTSASVNAYASRSPDGGSVAGEASFVHPGTKEISVKGRVEVATKNTLLDASADLDVFGDKKQKISVQAKIDALEIPNGRNITYVLSASSKGQNLKAEVKGNLALGTDVVSVGNWVFYTDSANRERVAGGYFKITKTKFGAKIKLPSQNLLDIQTDLRVGRDAQFVDGSIELIGLDFINIHHEIKDFNSFTGIISRKDDPNDQVFYKGGFAWGQVAEIRASKRNGNELIDLFYLTVGLDESHFLQTDYGGSLDAIKKTVEHVRKEGSVFAREAKIAIADSVLEANKEIKAVGEQLQKAQPSVKPIITAYQTDLKAIADELADEQLVQEISEFVKTALKLITESLNKFSDVISKFCEIGETFAAQISQIIKQWTPKLSARLSQLAEAITSAIETIVQAVANYSVKLIESVRQHEAEIKKIATVVGQAIQDIGRIVSKAVSQIRNEIAAFGEVISEQFKALPLSQAIKERYNQLKSERIPEQTLNVIREVLESIAATLPTPELSELVTVVSNYLEKRIKHEKVSDLEELKDIVNHALLALKSVIKLLRSQLNPEDIEKLVDLTLVPLPGTAWFNLPILSPIHLSPLRFLRSGDLPSPAEYYYTYRPTLNPLDWIPPYKAYGFLIDSHNFYTFNRKYYHFEGSCSYILAQDFVDGNFSLIASFSGGKLKAIQLSDPQNSFEILADKSLTVNGKPHEYPAVEGDLSAWKRYNNVNIRTKAGVWVTCDNKRDVCQFHISGFYHGKTRGLLGTNNYEPYTDFTLPNGKITSKSNELANAWSVGSGCKAQGQVEHDHEKETAVQECTNAFSSSSTLSSCFNYVNPAPFRSACNHLGNEVGDKKKAACDVAFAYAQACQHDRIKVDIPHSCASCSINNSPLAVDDVVSVKTPQKTADIVLVVEQISSNQEVYTELLSPLITTLTNDLKEKGLTDVHFSLLGFGGKNQKWPTHYGLNSPNIFFGAPANVEQPLDTPIKKLKWFKHQLDVETGNVRIVDAFAEAAEYPFRPDAVKTVIGFVGQRCENSIFPISLQTIRSFLRTKSLRDQGIALHIVTPIPELTVDGAPSPNLVCGDEDAVYYLSDAGKKPLVGNTEHNAHFDLDPCSRVALRSYGSVVSSTNFLATKGAQRKQFIDVVSQRITKGLVGGETQQECKCILSEGLYPRTSCKVTSQQKVTG